MIAFDQKSTLDKMPAERGVARPGELNGEVALSLTDVAVTRGRTNLLTDINLDLARGQMTALLGPNGAGKTTLLNCAAGKNILSSGSVTLNRQAIHRLRPLERARQMAVLPQQLSLNFPFSVEEVVTLGRYPHASGHELDKGIVTAVMKVLQVDSFAQRTYTTLSGGEKQRVQLARTISQLLVSSELAVSQDAVLLLDEPVAALDMPHQAILMDLLTKLCRQGLTVLVVLHDINLAAAYADNVALLNNGVLQSVGEVSEVINELLIKQVYGIEVSVIDHPLTGKPLVIR